MSDQAYKADAGKRPWHILPWDALGQLVDVMAFGAAKYGENNWQKLPNAEVRYFDALVRHLLAWRYGEDQDPESKIHHLAHVGVNALFLLALQGKK